MMESLVVLPFYSMDKKLLRYMAVYDHTET